MNLVEDLIAEGSAVQDSVHDGVDFFTELRERYDFGMKFDTDDRTAAELDTKFAASDQWTEEARNARNVPGKERPCLTENCLALHINQVVNDCRLNKPSITIAAMDGGDPDTAEMLQSRIRHIEYESDADIAYDSSAEQQISSSRGFYRVTTKERWSWDDATSAWVAEQYPCLEVIENQFSVIIDPAAKLYSREDAEWAFVTCTISKSYAKRKFGSATIMSMSNFFTDSVNPAPAWIGIGNSGDMILLAEYWYKDYAKDGSFKIKQCLTNGIEILDETEWIGSSIPIVPVWGRMSIVEGNRRHFSLIRNALDAQRLVNLYVSNIAEMISQMPKTPYIGAEGFMAGREAEWGGINNLPQAAIQYVMVYDRNGNAAPPPQRVTSEPPIQALVAGYLQAKEAIKAATGIFDAGLGARSNETSGLAIQSRQKESDVANFHFSDNQARSRKYAGRILLELIKILDGDRPKMVPVRHEDGKTEMVPVNRPYEKDGKQYHHDLQAGLYDVAVTTGPSYTSARQEENQRLAAVLQTAPELLMIMGDQFFETSDSPNSKAMAERMRRFIDIKNPGLIEKPKDNQPDLAKIQMQMQQMGQMIEHLTQENQQAQQIISTRKVEADAKLQIVQIQEENKKAIAEMQENTKVQVAEVMTKAQDQTRQVADMLATVRGHQEMAHDAAMAAQEHERAKELQQMQGDAALQQSQVPPPQEAPSSNEAVA